MQQESAYITDKRVLISFNAIPMLPK